MIEPHDEAARIGPARGAVRRAERRARLHRRREVVVRARRHASCSCRRACGAGDRGRAGHDRASSSAGKPGAALPVSPFEHWYAAEPAYLAGDYRRRPRSPRPASPTARARRAPLPARLLPSLAGEPERRAGAPAQAVAAEPAHARVGRATTATWTPSATIRATRSCRPPASAAALGARVSDARCERRARYLLGRRPAGAAAIARCSPAPRTARPPTACRDAPGLRARRGSGPASSAGSFKPKRITTIEYTVPIVSITWSSWTAHEGRRPGPPPALRRLRSRRPGAQGDHHPPAPIEYFCGPSEDEVESIGTWFSRARSRAGPERLAARQRRGAPQRLLSSTVAADAVPRRRRAATPRLKACRAGADDAAQCTGARTPPRQAWRAGRVVHSPPGWLPRGGAR